MQYDVNPLGGSTANVYIADITLYKGKLGFVEMRIYVAHVARRQVIKTDDLIVLVEQSSTEIAPYKPRTTCNQHYLILNNPAHDLI